MPNLKLANHAPIAVPKVGIERLLEEAKRYGGDDINGGGSPKEWQMLWLLEVASNLRENYAVVGRDRRAHNILKRRTLYRIARLYPHLNKTINAYVRENMPSDVNSPLCFNVSLKPLKKKIRENYRAQGVEPTEDEFLETLAKTAALSQTDYDMRSHNMRDPIKRLRYRARCLMSVAYIHPELWETCNRLAEAIYTSVGREEVPSKRLSKRPVRNTKPEKLRNYHGTIPKPSIIRKYNPHVKPLGESI